MSSIKKVFLGGPIQYALRNSSGFDQELKKLISSLLNELQIGGFKVFSAHQVEQFGKVDMSEQSVEVTLRDFHWMHDCDAYICVLPSDINNKPYRSDGTCIELGWASALQKTILIIYSPDVNYSHLINGLHSITKVHYLSVEQVIQNTSLICTTLQEK
ncbi:cytidine deoxyribosyltransferase [Beggiatoa sp. PS]|nr:cytidine deoxyribosyltransferase [Beggiatoa sp. PS]